MMLMPASAEFVALCHSQLAMMAEVVGADSTAVYLAEDWSDQREPKLLPIAIYPPATSPPATATAIEKALPAKISSSSTHLEGAIALGQTPLTDEPLYASNRAVTNDDQTTLQRLAIPMVHEGGVFGILVSWRGDRPWQETERRHLEACARSLTLACVMDQRGQWLKTQMTSLDRVQTQQSDRFHELLHQLRSPLTALKTFSKLLTKRLAKEDPNQTLVSNMLRESERMQELLGYFDDTLQAADDTREETATTLPLLAPAAEESETVETALLTTASGSLAHFGGTLNLRPCAVADLVTPLIDLTRPLAEDVGMQLLAIAPPQSVWVQTDARALVEILSNLLDNALKYAFPGTQIWLQWGFIHQERPELTGIVVGDTGPGIPAADQARIFERHYRGLQASGELEGSGLGLAIAADLAQEMHGSIAVYSPLAELPMVLPEAIQAPPNQGTGFIIWLPQVEAIAPI